MYSSFLHAQRFEHEFEQYKSLDESDYEEIKYAIPENNLFDSLLHHSSNSSNTDTLKILRVDSKNFNNMISNLLMGMPQEKQDIFLTSLNYFYYNFLFKNKSSYEYFNIINDVEKKYYSDKYFENFINSIENYTVDDIIQQARLNSSKDNITKIDKEDYISFANSYFSLSLKSQKYRENNLNFLYLQISYFKSYYYKILRSNKIYYYNQTNDFYDYRSIEQKYKLKDYAGYFNGIFSYKINELEYNPFYPESIINIIDQDIKFKNTHSIKNILLNISDWPEIDSPYYNNDNCEFEIKTPYSILYLLKNEEKKFQNIFYNNHISINSIKVMYMQHLPSKSKSFNDYGGYEISIKDIDIKKESSVNAQKSKNHIYNINKVYTLDVPTENTPDVLPIGCDFLIKYSPYIYKKEYKITTFQDKILDIIKNKSKMIE